MKVLYSLVFALALSLGALSLTAQTSAAPESRNDIAMADFQVGSLPLPSLDRLASSDITGNLSRVVGVLKKLSAEGILQHNGVANVAVVPTPEPGTYAVLASFLLVGTLVAMRRKVVRVKAYK